MHEDIHEGGGGVHDWGGRLVKEEHARSAQVVDEVAVHEMCLC